MDTINNADRTLFPDEYFSVECAIASKDTEKNNFYALPISYYMMSNMIKKIMPKVPEFRRFFKMITFKSTKYW